MAEWTLQTVLLVQEWSLEKLNLIHIIVNLN